MPNSSQKRVHKIPQRKAPNTCGFWPCSRLEIIFSKKKENKEKGEERGETAVFPPSSVPSLAIFFVIKNWNDETRTAITAHSPPLSPMHEQVTNEQKNEVFH